MSEGEFLWNETVAAGVIDDDNADYEDVLGTQMALDAADPPAPADVRGQIDEIAMEPPSTDRDAHACEDMRIYIDLDDVDSDIEIMGHAEANWPTPPVKSEELATVIKEESSDSRSLPSPLSRVVIDLEKPEDDEDVMFLGQGLVPIVKQEKKNDAMDCFGQNKDNGMIDLLDDEVEEILTTQDDQEPALSKTESQANSSKVSGSDAEDQAAKEISDTLTDTANGEVQTASDPSETLVPLHNAGITPDSVNQAKPDISTLEEMRRRYAEKARAKPIVTGAGSIFRGAEQLPPQSDAILDSIDPDDDTWMNEGLEDDERTVAEIFQNLKKDYKARKKAGLNTLEDDVKYTAAQNNEKARIKRYDADCLRASEGQTRDDSDQAAESDHELFLPEFPSEPPTAKRGRDMAASDFNEQASDNTDRSSHSKRQATKAKREQALELEKELQRNRLAGVEQILLAQQRKDEKEAEAKAKEERRRQQEQAKYQPKGPTKKPNQKTTAGKSTRKNKMPKSGGTKPGYLQDLRSLGFCNIYDDANVNAEKPAAPIDGATRKSEALKDLMVGVPLEDLRVARRDRANIIRASRTLGYRAVRPDGEGKWKMKGVASPLYSYQVQGSAFMRERETGLIKPSGGLLADQMGLGKTVMTMAAMVANRPAIGARPKTTLIVATPALVTQWMAEFEKHLEPDVIPGVIRYHSSSKIAGNGAQYMMQKADVLITTYGEVMKSYPRFNPPEDLKSLEEKLNWWDDVWETRGALHRVYFHRIVLDEAHAIKNHTAQTSVCCRALMAKHRWAITGTPIHNRVQELYPYFQFLRVPHTGSFEIFQKNFCTPEDEDCMDRLHTYLRQFMIRRTHATQLCGKPLIQLPKNHQRTVYVEFNNVERALYDMVHGRYVKGINHLSSQGMLEDKHNLILVMLNRLRQMTAHPFLIHETIERFLQTAETDELSLMNDHIEMEGSDTRGHDMASAIKRMMEAMAQPVGNVETEACQMDSTQHSEDSLVNDATKQPLLFKFAKFLRNLKSSRKFLQLNERRLCQKCKSPPEVPMVTSCLHLYCTECLNALAHDAAASGETETSCHACSTVFTESCSCEGLRELEADESLPSAGNRPVKRSKKDPNAGIKWMDKGGELLPSSKTAAVQTLLQQWLTEEPTKKIIVFSQFHMLMRIVGDICKKCKWGYTDYNGTMTHEARDGSLERFREHDNIKVLVASLKCGGVGLNLTAASKVICVDLWWNSAIEQQAFCRVFRIGQKNETFITRFVVQNTIDEKLEAVQKEKDAAIFAAIDDSKMLRKLSVTGLMRLFGPVREDPETGNPFIMTEDNGAGHDSDPEHENDGAQPQCAAKKKKKQAKAKGGKIAKGAKAAKGGNDSKKASGKGSRGGKGAKAAKAAQDEAELYEAIEREEIEERLDMPDIDV